MTVLSNFYDDSELTEERYYKIVSANSSESDDFIVPSGKVFDLQYVGGNASSTPLTGIQIIWDPAGSNELIFTTHGDSEQRILNKTYTGNGSKVLRIKLINDQSLADSLGGYWVARIS